MCNQGIERLQRSCETLIVSDQQHNRMDFQTLPSEETPRVKFLCSFGGSIMPRPQDGKLRYVGGETRIVNLPRDVNYEELMVRMRELFEGAAVLKYQQPDEDLDALVSVVNDDDVTNMMEEYDKVGSSDGFTRLRMFLFAYSDQESSSSLFDSDEKDSERRYVDALNSLNDGSDSRKQYSPDSPVMGSVSESLLNPLNFEFGLHNLRNCEAPVAQCNLFHLKIPHGQHQQTHPQRYNEMEAPCSPAYYSPRHQGHPDPRSMMEFPPTPSPAQYRATFGELLDKWSDGLPEEYGRQMVSHQPQFDHQLLLADNVVRLPPGAIPGDKAGYPGNPGHSQNVFEGNSICGHCRMNFQRNQTSSEAVHCPDSRWKLGGQPHLEPPNVGNEFHQFSNPCAECNPNRETAYVLNPDANLEHGVYSKEANEPQSFFTEAHNNERMWVLRHQLNHRVEEPRTPLSGAGRMNEHHVVDGASMNFPLAHGNCGHQVTSNYINHEDPRYVRAGPGLGHEVFHDQAVEAAPHIHIPACEDCGVRNGNFPAAYRADNLYQVSHGPTTSPALWMKVQNPLHATPSHEALNLLPQADGTVNTGFLQGMQECSPSFHVGLDNPSPWTRPSQKVFGYDGSAAPECFNGCAPKLYSNAFGLENHNPCAPGAVRSSPDMLDFSIPMEPVDQVSSSSSVIVDKLLVSATSGYNRGPTDDTNSTGALILEEKSMLGEGYKAMCTETVEHTDMPNNCHLHKNEEVDKGSKKADFDSNGLRPNGEGGDTMKFGETDATFEREGLSVERLSFVPKLIASVKKVTLEGAEKDKAEVQGNVDGDVDTISKDTAFQDLESENAHADAEVDSDTDHPNSAKIEPTKAEEEAMAKGVQMIKSDDLEEIRELGSGTYGAVYHGKWKGSDVAIKRIKASCFAGRPCERERLIADFWREALILSSLHHPNVVSFYGIVRDSPDGCLATVTEFMVNGSLKQFLQKKDRTIDRRKRLIIAMDTAFGMEYLHGKNIVHFDLKCENLLVNMRDPHRPICKIGDLGLSKVKQRTLVSGGIRGTIPWMAPELLSDRSNMVTERIDVYSFGIVMWELLTGEEPYAGMHCAAIIGGIVNNTLRPQVPSWCDPEWKSLMESCWASDPGERPSFSEISQKLRKMSAAINLK